MDFDMLTVLAPIILYVNAILVLIDAIIDSKREKEEKEHEE